MIVRDIELSDAQNYIDLRRKTLGETKFLMREVDEYQFSILQQQNMIRSYQKRDNAFFYVAEDDGKLVGYVTVDGGLFKRNQHVGYLVIAVLQDHVGKGVGSALMQKAVNAVKGKGMHRMELTVMTHNERAVNLYKKFGFEIEGIKKDDLIVDGEFVSEYYMGLVFE